MGPVRALLLFPVRPGECTTALAGRAAGACAPLGLGAAMLAYLAARGCALGDAAAAGAGAAVLVYALALGGWVASIPAAQLLAAGGRVRDRFGPCCAAAAWAPVLFVLVLAAFAAAGAGVRAAIFAAMFLLVWGAGAGFALLDPTGRTERGRGLVGSCLGLAGALGGFWLGLLLLQAGLVVVWRAPVAAGGLEEGQLLLLRPAKSVDAGELAFVRAPDGTSLLARGAVHGPPQPLGKPLRQAEKSVKLDVWARVFFRFGGRWGGSVVFPEQTP